MNEWGPQDELADARRYASVARPGGRFAWPDVVLSSLHDALHHEDDIRRALALPR